MVPEFKAPMAYSFITTFLAGQDYLPYTSNTTATPHPEKPRRSSKNKNKSTQNTNIAKIAK